MAKKLFDIYNYTNEQVRDLSIRQINSAFRSQDESHKFPINGRFNATERAIRRLRKFGYNGGLEYVLAMENEISNIVNHVL